MEIVTLKNSKLIVELINPESGLVKEIQWMLDKVLPKEAIEWTLNQNMCYFEWKIRHIFGGVL